MTLEEMRAARERGESLTDWERVRREALADKEPAEDEDSPDASEAIRAEIERRRGQGRRSGTKVVATIPFDPEVLDVFRATGPNWQSRINQALKEWIATHPLR